MTGEGVIRVTNFEGVNIQMALEGDEGLDYEYGDTYEAITAHGCAVGAPNEVRMPIGTWVMDTGCGHDLVGEKAINGYPVEYMNAGEAPTFSIANGKATATMVSPMYSEVLQETIRPYVMAETPAVHWTAVHGTGLFVHMASEPTTRAGAAGPDNLSLIHI